MDEEVGLVWGQDEWPVFGGVWLCEVFFDPGQAFPSEGGEFSGLAGFKWHELVNCFQAAVAASDVGGGAGGAAFVFCFVSGGHGDAVACQAVGCDAVLGEL